MFRSVEKKHPGIHQDQYAGLILAATLTSTRRLGIKLDNTTASITVFTVSVMFTQSWGNQQLYVYHWSQCLFYADSKQKTRRSDFKFRTKVNTGIRTGVLIVPGIFNLRKRASLDVFPLQ